MARSYEKVNIEALLEVMKKLLDEEVLRMARPVITPMKMQTKGDLIVPPFYLICKLISSRMK